ncbi:hypothetical protein AA313_de0202137 [Arthrobotrys entomopaga]|nr:hypothetical protein AA313_de0202137 [Arthrobotrys entomopaga]
MADTRRRIAFRSSAPLFSTPVADPQYEVSPPSSGLRRRTGYYDLKTKNREPSALPPRPAGGKQRSEEEYAAIIRSFLTDADDAQPPLGDAYGGMNFGDDDDDVVVTSPHESRSSRQPGGSMASPLSGYGSGNGPLTPEQLPQVRQTNGPEGSAHASLSPIVTPGQQPSPSVVPESPRRQNEGDNSTPPRRPSSESPAQPINLGGDEETAGSATISDLPQPRVSSSEAEGEGERGEESPILRRDPGELLRLFRAGAQGIHQEISQQRQRIREDLATTTRQQPTGERVWRMEGPDGAGGAATLGNVDTPTPTASAGGRRIPRFPGWWPPAPEGTPSGSSSSPSGGSGGRSSGSSPGRVLPNGQIGLAIAVDNPFQYNLVHAGTGRSTPLLDKVIDPLLLGAAAIEDEEVELQVPEPPVALAPIPEPAVTVGSDADRAAGEVPPPPVLVQRAEAEDDEEPEIPEDVLRLTIVDRFGAVWAPIPDEALAGLNAEDPAVRHALEQREERRMNKLRQYMAGTHGVVKYEAGGRTANDNVGELPAAAEDEASLSLAAGGSADGFGILGKARPDPLLSFWSTVVTDHAFINAHPPRAERFPPVKAKVREMDHGQRSVITGGELGGSMPEKAETLDGSEGKKARRERDRVKRGNREGVKGYVARRKGMNHPATPPILRGGARRRGEPSGFKKLLAFPGSFMKYVKERATYKKKGKKAEVEGPRPKEGQGYFEYRRVGRKMQRVWRATPTCLDEGQSRAANEERQPSLMVTVTRSIGQVSSPANLRALEGEAVKWQKEEPKAMGLAITVAAGGAQKEKQHRRKRSILKGLFEPLFSPKTKEKAKPRKAITAGMIKVMHKHVLEEEGQAPNPVPQEVESGLPQSGTTEVATTSTPRVFGSAGEAEPRL